MAKVIAHMRNSATAIAGRARTRAIIDQFVAMEMATCMQYKLAR